MPIEQKIGIGTGIKLGIGCFIGVVIAIVGCVAVLFFFGSTLLNSRQSQPTVTTATQPSVLTSRVPTVSELVQETNTFDEIAKLTEKNRQVRLRAHRAVSKTMPSQIQSRMIGPNETIMFFEGPLCNKNMADALIENFTNTPTAIEEMLNVGFTHIVITDGNSTTIRELKSGKTRYYNEGFYVNQ